MVARQTVVLGSNLESPQPTADCQSPGGLPPGDGTLLRADLYEGRQRRKLGKMNRWFAKKHIKKKRNPWPQRVRGLLWNCGKPKCL
jgi:hypothetical protein